MKRIADVRARQVLDSRGNPTLEVDTVLDNGIMGRASVPSGASTGSFEALQLRDNDPARYLGQGVLGAIANVHDIIAPRLRGMDATDQFRVDRALIELDGTSNKSRLGANAILGVSLSVCRAAAVGAGMPIYRVLGGVGTRFIPTPLLNIVNGGVHASNDLNVQEYMVVPAGFDSFSEALRAGAEIYMNLRLILRESGKTTSVGDEGGFAANFSDNEEPLRLILQAIEKAGYLPGEQIYLALDIAANEFYDDGVYVLTVPKEERLSDEGMIDLYAGWVDKYPIISIEDGLAEGRWRGWQELTRRLGERVQIVGDDLFATSVKRLEQGIKQGVANAVLVKPNQVGTVSETLDCIKLAHDNGYRTVISHRSGETDDHFIADLAAAVNSGQIKTGAPARGERVAKYNRLIRIEEEDRLPYAGLRTLKR